MKKNLASKIKAIPQKPGIYLFKDRTGRILYIGKAVNLRNRVKSHFTKGTDFYRTEWRKNIADIDWIEATNEKEALIIENELIKKYQPRYNIQWRDDKSYFWVALTDEQWPRIQVVHKNKLSTKNYQLKTDLIGPFVNGRELKQVLRALRKIIPYRTCKNSYNKPCLQWHLGLCPTHNLSCHSRPLRQSFSEASESGNPDPGSRIKCGMTEKDTISTQRKKYLKSLNALSQLLRLYAGEPIRIEAYDISNIHGAHATGSMIVFRGDKPKKSDYRRFRIKTVRGANDIAMLKEVLRRRLNHKEWPSPDLILIDGGRAQLNAARKLLVASGYSLVPILALAKKEEEIYTIYSDKALRLSALPIPLRLVSQAIRNEAHRFAIFYYRKLHRKTLQK